MRRGSICRVAHAFHDFTVGDSRCAEEDVVAFDEILGREHLIEVVPSLLCSKTLGIVPGPQLRLDRSPHATHRTGSDDPFRCAAHPGEDVDARAITHCHHGTGNVAIHDELDARASCSYVGSELIVARPIEDAYGEIGDPFTLRASDAFQGDPDRVGDVHHVGCIRAYHQLVHVEHRTGIEHRTTFGHCDDRYGVRHAFRRQRGAIDWIDRNIDFRARAIADTFTVEQHGGVVLFPLTDDDHTIHRDGADELAHRVDCSTIGPVLVTASDPPRGRHRSSFGDTHELEGQVAIGDFRFPHHHMSSVAGVCGCEDGVLSHDEWVSDDIPQPTGRSTGRLRQTVWDMVRSLAVVLGVVGVILLLTWRPQPDAVKVVDVAPYAALAASQADFPILQIPLPDYQPTSARWQPTLESDGAPVWFVGYVTPNGQYLQISQSTAALDTFIQEQTAGGVAGDMMDVGGQSWQRYETDERRSLVQRSPSGVTIVSGTESWDALATVAAVAAPAP